VYISNLSDTKLAGKNSGILCFNLCIAIMDIYCFYVNYQKLSDHAHFGGYAVMAFFEEVILTDKIDIQTTPQDIFNFLTGIVDDDSYRAWHSKDHVRFEWIKGEPWAEGSVIYAEEYIHGKLHKLKFRIIKIVPNERIEYTPVSRFIRFFSPKNEFIIKRKGDTCLFIASGTYRIGLIGKAFFSKAIEKGLSSVKKHMQEEGENLKQILEKE
jgi:hypothetical protein